jgi:hypothetical protein
MKSTLCLLGIASGLWAQSGSMEGTAINASTREPLSGVHIRLVGASFTSMTATYGAMSDRAGHFSMALIRPGTYVLSPERNGYLQVQPKAGPPVRRVTIKAGEKITGFEVEMEQRAVISGRVLDEAGDPVQGVRMQTVAVNTSGAPVMFSAPGTASTDDHGEFRILGPPGKYYVQATPNMVPNFGNERPEKRSDGTSAVSYASTFFPSAVRKDRATVVEAVAGKEVSGVEIRLAAVQAGLTLSGVVTGVPAGNNRGTIFLQLGESAQRTTSSRSAMVAPDGKYRFEGLMPGYYRVTAMFGQNGISLLSSTVEGQLDSAPVIVDLALTAGFELSGTVKMEGESADKQPGSPAAKRKVRLESAGNVVFGNLPMTGGEVDASGNFTITGIFPNKYRIRVSPLPENAYVKQLEIDGAAVTNNIADLSKTGRGASARIVLAPNGAQIAGRVVDANGERLSTDVNMVFLGRTAADIQLNNGDNERPGQDGKFTLRGIAPGKYRLLAIDLLQLGNGLQALESLTKAFEKAEELDIKEGDRIARDFKVTPLEDPHSKEAPNARK